MAKKHFRKMAEPTDFAVIDVRSMRQDLVEISLKITDGLDNGCFRFADLSTISSDGDRIIIKVHDTSKNSVNER